jgi:recombination protein RecA
MTIKAQHAAEATSTLKVVQKIRADIEKQHGPGSAVLLGERSGIKIDVVPTGSYGLDRALGIGGWPRGRIVELYGDASTGKTSLTLHAIASAQSLGLAAGFVDAEHALDVTYAKALGVRVDELLLSQPDNGEQGLSILEDCVVGGCGVVVVDSVAALTPKAEIEGEFGESPGMALHARLMSQALRKLTALVFKHNCLVFFVNQTRIRPGIVYGSPITVTGGNALKFYASVRCETSRAGWLKEKVKGSEETVGIRGRCKVVKSKVAAPFRQAEYDVRFGQGIDRVAEILDAAEESGAVERAGSWYSFAGERIGQGRENAVELLCSRPELLSGIEARLRAPAPNPEDLK